jgi:hypothetical protein
MYVHITCSPLHTSFHSYSLYFGHSHIQTNRIVGENEGVLTVAVDEEIERYMLVLLFHILLFCISFIICICVHLVYCMWILHTFLQNNLSSCPLYFLCRYIEKIRFFFFLHVFLHTNFLHVHCIFLAFLHLNKHSGWRG